MLYLLYPSVIEFIFFIVNKQTTSIPRTFEKLATPLVLGLISNKDETAYLDEVRETYIMVPG